ncbi:cytochrome c oxidase assembly factor 1 family protein [Occallatibacter riparius]|uniref:Cytochrome c oxidase assembly factor 1 family protein n=1 Tax=Occallatibacter riparius TaxID=1002689 RepID=A0A9J7BV65_9BACT|nr:cytochrome c oxidase assembly factor 1 family protein [Occallatibacter riparius]UWZ86504.1 cytochrome c oxidase assembly factor 1 family protein [Occallatibacter riparius]
MPTANITPQKSWIQRHWKWILPVCLALAGIFFPIAYLMHNSEARQLAILRADASPTLAARLGHPLKYGWFSEGEISVNEAAGHAELTFSVSGPKGKGNLYVEAHKRARFWELDSLDFGDGQEADTLDLLREPTSGSAPHN